tara:strand:- start:633 stop:986 length:354 start_codon:yes stop_codon:yes gene_type:complete
VATTEKKFFKQVKINGGYKYYINGLEVSQAEFNSKRAEQTEKIESFKKSQKEGLESAKKRREEFLESQPKTIEERKKQAWGELESAIGQKKGGLVKKKKTKKTNSRSIAKKYFKGIF